MNEGFIDKYIPLLSRKKLKIGDKVEFKNVLDEIYQGEIIEIYEDKGVYKIKSIRDYRTFTNLVKRKDILNVIEEPQKENKPQEKVPEMGSEQPVRGEKVAQPKDQPEPPPKIEDLPNPENVQLGDYLIVADWSNLLDTQITYLESRPYFVVGDIIPKKDGIYVDIGYKIPLKLSRFTKIENPSKTAKYRILFFQFDNKIDLMGEEDKGNFFKGYSSMGSLFTDLFSKRLDDVFVCFAEYKDVYKMGGSYFIDEIDIKDYDFVFFGFMSKFTTITRLILDYLNKNGVPYIKYGNFQQYDNKAYEFQLIEDIGYPYIPSVLTTRLTNDILEHIKEFGYPLIVKDVNLNQGKGVKQVDNEKELREAFRFTCDIKLIQKYIPNDGEYRVILINNKVVLIAKKDKIDKVTHKEIYNRKSQKSSLPESVINMCEDVSKYLFCDIVGIDIIQDSNTGQYYIMEMNSSPHLPMFSVVTEVNVPEIIVDYIINTIKKD